MLNGEFSMFNVESIIVERLSFTIHHLTFNIFSEGER